MLLLVVAAAVVAAVVVAFVGVAFAVLAVDVILAVDAVLAVAAVVDVSIGQTGICRSVGQYQCSGETAIVNNSNQNGN